MEDEQKSTGTGSGLTRRRFLQVGAASAVGLIGSPYLLQAAPLNKQKLRVAFVGAGGRALAHINLAKEQQLVTYCDIDTKHWDKLEAVNPAAPAYTDWREMFDKHEKEFDAVVVAVPDHSHAGPAMRAIRGGKHVYCEKPLTWSIAEARALAEATAEHKVATQMGNQGHSNEGNRLTVEWIRAGAIGDVVEVHTWTDRPIWPQGDLQRGPTQIVPANMNWDAWIGPAPFREFHEGLHPFKWRGWFDFGCGAVGDMGCHLWDGVFWSMAPDYPTSAQLVKIDQKGHESFPRRSHFKWDYPAKGARPAFTAHWYSGGWKPEAPEEFLTDPTRQTKDANGKVKPPRLPGAGSIYIGTKGKLLVEGSYGEHPRLIPESTMKAYQRPPKTIPRSPGHMQEFVLAATGEKPWDYPGSNISGYGGPLTEAMLLGSLTEKIGQVGFMIECDPTGRTIKTPEALALVTRERRRGWEL